MMGDNHFRPVSKRQLPRSRQCHREVSKIIAKYLVAYQFSP